MAIADLGIELGADTTELAAAADRLKAALAGVDAAVASFPTHMLCTVDGAQVQLRLPRPTVSVHVEWEELAGSPCVDLGGGEVAHVYDLGRPRCKCGDQERPR